MRSPLQVNRIRSISVLGGLYSATTRRYIGLKSTGRAEARIKWIVSGHHVWEYRLDQPSNFVGSTAAPLGAIMALEKWVVLETLPSDGVQDGVGEGVSGESH
jgi:hypothetical protein